MKKLFVSFIFLGLIACDRSATTEAALVETLSKIPLTTPIACRFNKVITSDTDTQNSNWYFWRQTQRTETRDEVSNQGEIWEHDASDRFFYTHLFYNERVALEFMPGDLAATGTALPWEQLTSLIDPKTLGKELMLLSKKNFDKVVVEYYRGAINGVATEVDWLPDLKLPIRVTKKLPQSSVALTLAECKDNSSGNAKLALKPITKAEFDDFHHLDYTDLGDMEDDPMIRHIQQLMGGHQHSR